MNEIYWNIPLIEWIGYVASTLVLISLSLSSLVKLRIYNFFGSSVFSFYGFYIGALPVGIMNLLIAIFNIYYLRFLLFKKELFDVIKANEHDEFLNLYLDYHHKDIERYFPQFNYSEMKGSLILLALRDAKVAGVFMVSAPENNEVEIVLDYVTPEYRDYKTGRFLLQKYQQQYVQSNVTSIVCRSSNSKHINYLTKIGFEESGMKDKYVFIL